MDTAKNENKEILDFSSFIKKYFDWYQIDGFNNKIIQNLWLYATRNPKFNGIEKGWHIDRAILLWGNPGSGKDEMFRLLNQYLHYLKSPYVFDHKVVWEFAAKFTEKDGGGYKVFSEEGRRNRYYEELALTNEKTGQPERETVQHFGNKILIGAELIHIAHNGFKNYGVQAHFSTNLEEGRLLEVYGERSFSRLKYMCNFMKMAGMDRRKEEEPVFLKNINQPPGPPQPRELDIEEHKGNKELLERHYQEFLDNKLPSVPLSIIYNLLVSYGVQVADDEELRSLMEIVAAQYMPDNSTAFTRKTPSEKEKAKNAGVWEISKTRAVTTYFSRLQQSGAKSIFNEVEVNIGEIIEGLVKENKQNQ